MKKYIIEVNNDYRMSDITSFDPTAKGVEVMPQIWQIETSLFLSQLLLLKNVLCGGNDRLGRN